MRNKWWMMAGIAAALAGAADSAFAWGPAMHVGLGASVLNQLGLLPAGLAAILARHAVAYLYGNIAADVVFAKRWSRVKQFCHHWSTAFSLCKAAEDDRARAFAYGYLSHLAADTVAHGKFVPRQVMVSGCSLNFGHFYWELRADALCPDSSWRLLECVLAEDHNQHHLALERQITDTFLPYDLNRLLFDRMNALSVRDGFRKTIGAWSRYSRWRLPPDLVEAYRLESLERIRAVLVEGEHSPVLRDDPNGTSALMRVRVRRREARRLRRRGLPVELRMIEASYGFAPRPDGCVAKPVGWRPGGLPIADPEITARSFAIR
jgi:hypothetical protein